MDQETIKLYDPKNAKNLTQEQIDAMQDFTNDDIKALAEAYPNKGSSTTYLVLKNSKKKEVRGEPGTWQSLYNLRVKLKQTNYSAFTFRSIWKGAPVNKIITSKSDLRIADTQDLTGTEVSSAEGVKRAGNTTAAQIEGDKSVDEVEEFESIDEFPDLEEEAKTSIKKPTTKPASKIAAKKKK